MSPDEIIVLIHCNTSTSDHPRITDPYIKEAHCSLMSKGLIEQSNQGQYRTTGRGKAHIEVLCLTPLPEQAWLTQFGNVIKI